MLDFKTEKMEKKFKLVYCIGSLAQQGGTEKVLASKANYMVNKLGHEVHIIIIDQKGVPLVLSLIHI